MTTTSFDSDFICVFGDYSSKKIMPIRLVQKWFKTSQVCGMFRLKTIYKCASSSLSSLVKSSTVSKQSKDREDIWERIIIPFPWRLFTNSAAAIYETAAINKMPESMRGYGAGV